MGCLEEGWGRGAGMPRWNGDGGRRGKRAAACVWVGSVEGSACGNGFCARWSVFHGVVPLSLSLSRHAWSVSGGQRRSAVVSERNEETNQ